MGLHADHEALPHCRKDRLIHCISAERSGSAEGSMAARPSTPCRLFAASSAAALTLVLSRAPLAWPCARVSFFFCGTADAGPPIMPAISAGVSGIPAAICWKRSGETLYTVCPIDYMDCMAAGMFEKSMAAAAEPNAGAAAALAGTENPPAETGMMSGDQMQPKAQRASDLQRLGSK